MRKLLPILILAISLAGLIRANAFYYLKRWITSSFTHQDYIDPSALNGNGNDETIAYFEGEEISIPQINFTAEILEVKKPVLGDNNGRKHIEVDLTSQRLYAYEGGQQIFNFLISSGKWGRTPTGDFQIWVKLRSTKMSGGSRALHTYYYLPNVPYVMYFYNTEVPKIKGYSTHGTYWHNNFGQPMSHGCVNMRTSEAKLLYDWAEPLTTSATTYATEDNPGTLVQIYGQAPPY